MRFSGLNRRGIIVVGETDQPIEAFVREKFNTGFRNLDVTDGDGNIVGQIARHAERGFRIWWSA